MRLLPLSLAAAAFMLAHPVAAEEAPLEPLKTREVKARTDVAGASLDAIERYLNGIHTLKATFVQIAPDGAVSRGYFFLERPGKVRFEYEEDVPILIVSDGTLVNFIDYEIGQITRWPVKDTPLALLLEDRIAFGDNVEVSDAGPGPLANMTAVSAHDPEKPEQGMLTLLFSKEQDGGLQLQAWEVVDAQGALTTIALSDFEANVALKPSLWEFEDPRGQRFQRRRRQ